MIKEYPYLAKKLKMVLLTEEQINQIILMVMRTCSACWDAPTGCQCWNDK